MFQLNKAATVASEAWNFVFLDPATSGCVRTGAPEEYRGSERILRGCTWWILCLQMGSPMAFGGPGLGWPLVSYE